MTILGLCTHLTESDEWAFDYAFRLAQKHAWQLNICHWLHSPFLLRRDVVNDDLFHPTQAAPITPELLTRLEYQLRSYYDPKLGDYTQVAFKLCEGQYQVELTRCFHKHQLDLVVMGYQWDESEAGAQPLEDFAAKLPYPLILVGKHGPNSFLLNQKAMDWIDQLDLAGQGWMVLEAALIKER